MKRFFCMLLSFSIIASGVLATPLAVRAEVVGGYNPFDNSSNQKTVVGVYQSDGATDFVKRAPIATIFIDENMIDEDDKRNACTAVLLENSHPRAKALRIGPVKGDSTTGFGKNAGEKFLIFDNSLLTGEDAQYRIKRGQNNVVPGPLASFTFPDAAETIGGKKCDVVFTYSDLNIVLQSYDVSTTENDKKAITSENEAALESFCVAGGNLLQIAGTERVASTDPQVISPETPSQSSKGQRYGMSVNVNVSVVDKDGNRVPGDFYFRIVDIDVMRRNDGAGFKALFGSGYQDKETDGDNANYDEHVQLLNGYKTDPSSVYVPGGKEPEFKADGTTRYNKENTQGYKCNIEYNENDKTYMFMPGATDDYPDKDGSFYSGFLAVADNTTGINLRAWLAGCGSATVTTKLLAGFKTNTNIVFTVTSSTGTGGNIETTSTGNLSGDLSDGNVIGPSKLSISAGKKVIYKLTPDTDKCSLKKLTVDGTDIDINNLSDKLQKHTDSSGNTYWTYEFEAIIKNHTIHVEWEHPPYTETYRYSDNTNIPQAVRATLPSRKIWYDNGETAKALYPGQKATTDERKVEVIVGDKRYTFKGWVQASQQIDNATVEFVGSWIVTNVSDQAPVVNYDPQPNPQPNPQPQPQPTPQPDPQPQPTPTPTPVDPQPQPAQEWTPLPDPYAVQLAARQEATKAQQQKPTNSPPTGDDAPVRPLVMIMVGSAVTATAAVKRRRQSKRG